MNNKRAFISTPIWIYLIILVVFIAFILISVFLCKCEWWKNLWLNFGYGTFASLVVSVLIDIGNTRKAAKEQEAQFRLLNQRLVSSAKKIGKMLMYAVEKFSKHSIDSNKTYDLNELVNLIITNDKKQNKQLSIFLECISEIQKHSDTLIELSSYNVLNAFINEEYITHLNNIVKICKQIDFGLNVPILIDEEIETDKIKSMLFNELIPEIDTITFNEVSKYYKSERFSCAKMITF